MLATAIAIGLVSASGPLFDAAAATVEKSYFYASREACEAAGLFRKRECAAAFANSQTELRDRAPTFSSRAECRLQYHYCEARRAEPRDDEDASEVVYSPLALGVELVAAPRGVEAAPVLAIETPPALFPRFPVAREYLARERLGQRDGALAYNAILPADRFGPFPKNSAAGAIASFVPTAPRGDADLPINVASHEETPEERRARLKNAPFVE